MRTEKPWGYEELISANAIYVVKRILVRERHRLSLQFHKVKRETWLIQKGEGTIILGDKTFDYSPGMVVDIEPGTVHRISSSLGNTEIIEVSTPELDDIVRLEDDYGRVPC